MKKQIMNRMLGIMKKDTFQWESVQEVNPEQISQLVNSMVMFFAPWCGHCKTAKPIFELVAKGVNQPVYAINCDMYSDVADMYGVQGFPTFGMISNGTFTKYKGSRTVDEMISFLVENGYSKKTFFDSVKEVSPEELDQLINQIVMFFAPWCGHCISTKVPYQEFAKQVSFPIYAFNCDSYSSKAEEYKVDGFPTIARVNQGKIVSTYQGNRTSEDLIKWANSLETIQDSSHNLNQKLNLENTLASNVKEVQDDSLFQMGTCIVMFYSPSCSHCVTAKPIFDSVSIQTDIPCYRIDCKEHRDIGKKYNIDGYPTFKCFKNGIVTNFTLRRTVENMLEWIRNQ